MGRIRSVPRKTKHPRNTNMLLPRPGKILRSEYDKCGYPVVTLSLDNKQRTFKIHRLVARTFIPNPENLPQVNHINAKRYDNRPENLRWCTTQQNTKWRDEQKQHRLRKKVVCKETRKVFETSYSAAEWLIRTHRTQSTNYKTISNTIRRACDIKEKKAYNFHWAYIEGSTTSSDERRAKSSKCRTPCKADEDIV